MTRIEPCFGILSMALYDVFERRFFLPPTALTKLRFLLVFERNILLCEFSWIFPTVPAPLLLKGVMAENRELLDELTEKRF